MVTLEPPQVIVRVPLPLSTTLQDAPSLPFVPSFTVADVPSVQEIVVVPSPFPCAEQELPLAPSAPLLPSLPLQAVSARTHSKVSEAGTSFPVGRARCARRCVMAL